MIDTSIVKQVKEQWTSQQVLCGGGISSEEVKNFEHENNVILPGDFCEYLTTINGMVDGGSDNDLISFLPLEEIKPCICGDEPAYQVISENFYIFADYSIGIFYYAIELLPFASPINRICVIGASSPIFMAESFTEFLRIYLAGEAANY